uniref:Putative ovule protein n=1 Tax=Solanum chacoense TaxID=4108 RepID=A0A0V0HA13_SOLCH
MAKELITKKRFLCQGSRERKNLHLCKMGNNHYWYEDSEQDVKDLRAQSNSLQPKLLWRFHDEGALGRK